MKKAKAVLHHDDPPCNARLNNRYCPECKFHPDMQSICLMTYCPECDYPLEKMKCPKCGKKFKSPF
jgi:hypothetical protein